MKTAILTLGCYVSSGGPSKSVSAFQRALDAKVIAWVDPADQQKERLVFTPNAVVEAVRAPLLRSLLYPAPLSLPAAAEIVASSDFVSTHLFWRWHCPWIYATARDHKVPYWFVPHGALDPYVFGKNTLAKNVFAKTVAAPFLRHAPAVVCSTTREYQKLRKHVPRAKAFVLPWPLENADVRTHDDRTRAAVRDRLGIPENAPCFLFLGRLHPMKRPLETILAVAQSAVASAHLIVVGNEYGITVDECKRLAGNLDISDRVHMIGPAYGSEKRDYFDAADVFISLSYRENFNFAAMEALASGLPLILSPGNDIAEDLRNLDCSWLLPDVSAATEAIRLAAAMPKPEVSAMGARGRRWAADTLTFEQFQDRLTAYAAEFLELTSARHN